MRRAAPPVLLAALAAAVRLPAVWRDPLSQDEVFSARIMAAHTVAGAVHRVVRTESTPPLWYLLAFALHHAGVPITDVRLLSVALGAALCAVVYLVARSILPPWPAAAAAALAAVAYQPVVHGSQLRAYELLAALAATLALLLVEALRHPGRRIDAAIAATVWAGLLAHYFFLYVVAVALAWTWLEPRARPLRRRATFAFAAGAALASPWLPAFAAQYRHDHFWWIGPFSARVVVTTPLRLFVPLPASQLALGAVGAVLLGLGVVRLGRLSAEARLVAGLAAGPLVLAAGAWAAGARTYDVRNLIETAPFLAVCAGALLAKAPGRLAPAGAAATVGTVAFLSLAQASLPSPPFGRFAHDLVALGWRPADPIAVVGNFFTYRAPLEWYLPHEPLLDVSRPAGSGCSAVFVIAPYRAGDATPLGLEAARREHGFLVGRLARLPGARPRLTILATRDSPRSCVRLSRNPRLEPLA